MKGVKRGTKSRKLHLEMEVMAKSSCRSSKDMRERLSQTANTATSLQTCEYGQSVG